MPSSFHDISDVEFQDNWALESFDSLGKRMCANSEIPLTFFSCRVDLGTSNYLGLDVLLNCLTQFSSE
jgi:hypothetical protein